MIRFNTPPKFSRQILMLTAGIFLLAAMEGALAKNGGNSNDRGGMRSGNSGRDRDHGGKRSEKHADKDRNGDKHAEKHKNRNKDKISGTTANNHNTPSGADRKISLDPGTGGKVPTDPGAGRKIPIDPGPGGKPVATTNGGDDLFGRGVVGRGVPKRVDDREHLGDGKHKMPQSGGKPVETSGEPTQPGASNSGTPAAAKPLPIAAPAPGTGGTNTIHPIPSPAPVAAGSGSPTGATPPVNTIHPIPGSAPGVVTVSNGVTKYEIQNGPGGVAVYSGSPGTITVTNGKESKTLNGGSLTLSGNVIGVGAAQGIQVGARNGEGNTVVAIKPPAPTGAKPSGPTDIGHVTTGDGSITVTGDDVLKRAGQTGGAIYGGTLAPLAAPSVAAYGFVKGGVAGAYKSVSSTAKSAYRFFSGGF